MCCTREAAKQHKGKTQECYTIHIGKGETIIEGIDKNQHKERRGKRKNEERKGQKTKTPTEKHLE